MAQVGQDSHGPAGRNDHAVPLAGHLVSGAKYAPGVQESAGKKGKNPAGHGNTYLARILGNAAAAAGRTDTFPGERYRRIARRRGVTKANVAIGRSILVIAWHLPSDPDARFAGLGSDSCTTRIDPDRRMRNHVRQLEALGYTVTLEPQHNQSSTRTGSAQRSAGCRRAH